MIVAILNKYYRHGIKENFCIKVINGLLNSIIIVP